MKSITPKNISDFKEKLIIKFDELKEGYKENKMVSFYRTVEDFFLAIRKQQISKEDKLLLFDALEQCFTVVHDEYLSHWNKIKDTHDEDQKSLVWPPTMDCMELKKCFASWRKDIEHPEEVEKANRELLDMLD